MEPWLKPQRCCVLGTQYYVSQTAQALSTWRRGRLVDTSLTAWQEGNTREGDLA